MDTKTPASVAQPVAMAATQPVQAGPQPQIEIPPKPSVSPTQQADTFRKFIESEVLAVVVELSKQGEAAEEKIKEIADLTLKLIKPGMSLEELYTNAVKLDDRLSELAPIVMKIMKEYEQTYEKKALIGVSKLIKEGKYDEAQDMVKKVLLFKFAN